MKNVTNSRNIAFYNDNKTVFNVLYIVHIMADTHFTVSVKHQ